MPQFQRKVAASAVARRLRLRPEAMEMLRFHVGDSPRQRILGVVRLSLAGAILGAALTGVGGLVFGYDSSQTPDLLGAAIGAAVVAAIILTHLEGR